MSSWLHISTPEMRVSTPPKTSPSQVHASVCGEMKRGCRYVDPRLLSFWGWVGGLVVDGSRRTTMPPHRRPR